MMKAEDAMPESQTIADLIAALSRRDAYPQHVDAVEVHQTHISVVFLAGAYAYKIKKPVNLGFVDFSTLEKRKYFCDEEVRLNRRLAPHVYLGVTPITEPDAQAREAASSNACASGSKPVQIGGAGPVVEWAVQMKRLPHDAALEARLARGEVTEAQIRALAQRVAAFHRDAETNECIASFGRFEVVAANARENFLQTAEHVHGTVSLEHYERMKRLTDSVLAEHQERIDARAARGMPRDTHGDLRVDHVYLFPEQAPPEDLVIIDCIEFSDRFRYADPVADIAFLAMDLTYHGHRHLARILTDAYFDASQDEEGRSLLPYYVAYRAMVRAKVDGMKSVEPEVDGAERGKAIRSAQAHWLLALGELAPQIQRPALILLAGLPGSGKSTLARRIASLASFEVFRSDVIRKRLTTADFYSREWTERTYDALLRHAHDTLFETGRVIVDANFREDAQRRRFFDAAKERCVPMLLFQCQTTPETAHARLNARTNDASDADWTIYQKLADAWEPIAADMMPVTRILDTSGTIEESEQALLAILRDEGLFH
jgi:uncharacterized protein